MKYAVVIERVPESNNCAYVPDLPGCVSTGELRADGDPIPEPGTNVFFAEVA